MTFKTAIYNKKNLFTNIENIAFNLKTAADLERISRKMKFLDYQMGLFSKEIQIIEVEFGVELKIRA